MNLCFMFNVLIIIHEKEKSIKCRNVEDIVNYCSIVPLRRMYPQQLQVPKHIHTLARKKQNQLLFYEFNLKGSILIFTRYSPNHPSTSSICKSTQVGR